MKRLTVVAVALGLCLGCITTPISYAESKSIPPERVTRDAGSLGTGARIIFIRDTGMFGGGCFLSLWVDGKMIARIDPAERLDLNVAPGEHLLKIAFDPEGRGLCGVQDQKLYSQVETVMKAGDVKAFRVGANPSSGELLIMRSGEDMTGVKQ